MNSRAFDEGRKARKRSDVFNGPSQNPYDYTNHEERRSHEEWIKGFRRASEEMYPEFYDD